MKTQHYIAIAVFTALVASLVFLASTVSKENTLAETIAQEQLAIQKCPAIFDVSISARLTANERILKVNNRYWVYVNTRNQQVIQITNCH